jgi:hypothetical protein
MNKEEKKEYIKNILQMVLTGTQENYSLAETLIESLNLQNDFEILAEKEIKIMKVKKSFLESQVVFNKNVSYLENLERAGEIGSDIMNIKLFLSNRFPF